MNQAINPKQQSQNLILSSKLYQKLSKSKTKANKKQNGKRFGTNARNGGDSPISHLKLSNSKIAMDKI